MFGLLFDPEHTNSFVVLNLSFATILFHEVQMMEIKIKQVIVYSLV